MFADGWSADFEVICKVARRHFLAGKQVDNSPPVRVGYRLKYVSSCCLCNHLVTNIRNRSVTLLKSNIFSWAFKILVFVL